MTTDRRAHQRVWGPFEAKWEEHSGTRPTILQVRDLSVGGCFVEAPGQLPRGERFRLKLELPQGDQFSVGCQLVRREASSGFAVRFLDLTVQDQNALARTVREVQKLDSRGSVGTHRDHQRPTIWPDSQSTSILTRLDDRLH